MLYLIYIVNYLKKLLIFNVWDKLNSRNNFLFVAPMYVS
jgi:hypothetical protein